MQNVFTNMTNELDRPRGILTAHNRRFLHGEVEYDYKQAYSNRRRDIRERVANGLLDFVEIRHLLSSKDRKLIFREPDELTGVDDTNIPESVEALLYWSYYGLKEQRYDFDSILTAAIEDAERDFAREYWGESIDAFVQFDVKIERKGDTETVVKKIEQGGPVNAERIYELLQIPRGVPIETSELDTVRVWFSSSYPEGEKKVLEALFKDYLGVAVEITGAVDRITEFDDKESAVIDPDSELPDPSEIKGRPKRTPSDQVESDMDRILKKRAERNQDTRTSPDEPSTSLIDVVDELAERSEGGQLTIEDVIAARETDPTAVEPITSEAVVDLLTKISDPVVSTTEVAAAIGCDEGVARHILSSLADDLVVSAREVHGDEHTMTVWWLE